MSKLVNNNINYNHKNAWKDVLLQIKNYINQNITCHFNTYQNQLVWLSDINNILQTCSRYHPYMAGFAYGWEIRYFSSPSIDSNTLILIAVDANGIGYDLEELGDK